MRKKKRSQIIDIIKFTAVALAGIWLLVRGSGELGYNWQMYRIPQYLFTIEDGVFNAGPLLKGLAITLQISGISLVLAFTFGLVAALLRLSDSFVARSLARIYLELVRNTPLLVQIFFIYFVMGPILDIDRFFAAILALSLFEGAYASEIFRAGIVAIHKGQWEAAHSLGMNLCHIYRWIILPQVIRRILPTLVGQGISLIKDSALVSTIAVYDLTMRGQVIVSKTFLTFEVWFTIAAIYLVITATLSFIVNMLENRIKIIT
jgi:polar amino acid transport system permease protein